MKHILIFFLILTVILVGPVSCKKPEEAEVEEIQAYMSEEETLGQAMKKASRDTKRLAGAIESKDWVEIEMWAKELKEGIGYSCVELYMKEHRGVSSEFVIMGSRFFDAVRNLILLCKEHNTETIDVEFNRLLTTCDDCHEIYKENEELPLTLRNDL